MTSYNVSAVVDFIAASDDPEIWRLVLVEEGPWDEVDFELTRLQDRLYNCLDGALDGQIAQKFPDTNGKTLLIQLDCYKFPDHEVSKFFSNFSENVMEIPDYAEALLNSDFVNGFKFKLNLEKYKM